MSPEYTKNQYANLYGRAEGLLEEEVRIAIIENTSPRKIKIICNGSTKTSKIPNNAKVTLYMRNNLRIQKEELGINSEVFKDTEYQSKAIDIGSKFGTKWKEIKWELKITTSDSPGKCWAWTKYKRLLSGESLFKFKGDSILRIRADDLPNEIAWKMEFPDEDFPTIVVNSEIEQLSLAMKENSLVSCSLLPEIVSNILDQIILNCAEIGSEEDIYYWQEKWLNFIKNKFPNVYFPGIQSNDSESIIQLINWKRDVVNHVKNYLKQKTEYIQILNDSERSEA